MLNGYQILTVTHGRTPLQHIEKFVITHSDEADLRSKLEALKAEFGLDELAYLATCNRVMFFFHTEHNTKANFASAFFKAINPSLSEDFIGET
jgi:glutamyl-tRNA reductase